MKINEKLRNDAKDLSSSMYRLIGETLNCFNILEDYLRTSIADMVGIFYIPDIEIVFGRLGSRQLIDIFESLVILRTSLARDFLKRRKVLICELKKRAEERNKFAHAIWGIEFINNERISIYHLRYVRAKKDNPISSFSQSFSETELRQFIKDTQKTYSLIDSFMKDYFKRYPIKRGAR